MGNFAAGDVNYIAKLNALQDAQMLFSTQAANFNAAAGNEYLLTANGITATLPASPTAGMRIRFKTPDAGVTTFTLGRNGNKIRSASADYAVPAGTFWIELVYQDATVGWTILVMYGRVKKAPAISANVLTLDLELGLWPDLVFEVSLNANITTYTVSNPPPSGSPYIYEVCFVADGTLRTVSWPASHKWPAATAPTLTSTSTKRDRFGFETWDGGTAYYANVVGQAH